MFFVIYCQIRQVFIICTLIKYWGTIYKMVIELDLKFLCEKRWAPVDPLGVMWGEKYKRRLDALPLRINHPLMLNIYGKLTITRFFRSMCACVCFHKRERERERERERKRERERERGYLHFIMLCFVFVYDQFFKIYSFHQSCICILFCVFLQISLIHSRNVAIGFDLKIESSSHK